MCNKNGAGDCSPTPDTHRLATANWKPERFKCSTECRATQRLSQIVDKESGLSYI